MIPHDEQQGDKSWGLSRARFKSACSVRGRSFAGEIYIPLKDATVDNEGEPTDSRSCVRELTPKVRGAAPQTSLPECGRQLLTTRELIRVEPSHFCPVRNESTNRYRIDADIDNASILRPQYDRFDVELRSIDVIDEISINDFLSGESTSA